MMNSLYAVFRKYCREHGEELILGAFDQFVFIYFIILLINCEKQRFSSDDLLIIDSLFGALICGNSLKFESG